MPIPTVNVFCPVMDQNGAPVAGAVIMAVLDRPEVYQGYVVPRQVEVVADANGEATLQLFPNALGAEGSRYKLRVTDPKNGHITRLMATIPAVDCNLWQVANLPSMPQKTEAQVAQDEALGTLQGYIHRVEEGEANIAASEASASAAREGAVSARNETQALRDATQILTNTAGAAAQTAQDSAQAVAEAMAQLPQVGEAPSQVPTNAVADAKYVPKTRTVAGKALSADVTLQAADVGLANVTNEAQIAKSVGTTAGDMIFFNAAGVPVRLPKGQPGQALLMVGDLPSWQDMPQSGASKWTALAASTDYAATPASTSTLHMTTDQTAAIKPGMALRYVIGGVAYYGVVTAVTSGLLTVAGAPLSGDVTALDYSIFPGMVETMTLSDPGAWADSADTALVANDLLIALVWPGPPAALVRIQAWTRTTDTGTNKPRINARLGETPTDSVSTDKSNAGLELVASSTWTATGVDIDPAKYAVSLGTAIELRTDANGSNDDARDLTVVLTFVYA